MPSARVMRAVPPMIAARSPIFESRSKRCQLQSRHAELQRVYDRQAGEQAPLRGEVEELRGQLRRAVEINNQLYERLEAAGIVGLAGGLLSSLLQPKPKKE